MGGRQEGLPHTRGQRQQLGGATSYLRSGRQLRGANTGPRLGAAAYRSNPKSKERWLHRLRRTERSYSMLKVRRGGCEEIPFIQGKEQQLHFARVAVKRYHTSKVKETQVGR